MAGLIACDIDGTLINSNHEVSRRTCEAIAAVQDAGWTFVLATGRPPRWLAPIRDQLVIGEDLVISHPYAICSNGAVVMDIVTEDIVSLNAFDPANALEVIQTLRALEVEAGLGVEWSTGFAYGAGYRLGARMSELFPGAVTPIDNDQEFAAQPIVKILLHVYDTQSPELSKLAPSALPTEEHTNASMVGSRAAEALGDLATVTWSSADFVEISSPGVTKASTLATFAADRGITQDQVVAIGDMPNDLAMLRWAGRGVAMGNAQQAVQQAADEVTDTNDNHGVAQVLESLC